MGVTIEYWFTCDGCGRSSGGVQAKARKLDRSETEALLSRLREQQGWGRMRRAGEGGYGEFCPACVEAILEDRDRAAAARKKAR